MVIDGSEMTEPEVFFLPLSLELSNQLLGDGELTVPQSP